MLTRLVESDYESRNFHDLSLFFFFLLSFLLDRQHGEADILSASQ